MKLKHGEVRGKNSQRAAGATDLTCLEEEEGAPAEAPEGPGNIPVVAKNRAIRVRTEPGKGRSLTST